MSSLRNRLILVFLLAQFGAVMVLPFSSWAAKPLLFAKGTEAFTVKNEKGQTPIFKVLQDTPTKRALAVALASALNANRKSDGTQGPKIPVRQFIELKIEKLKIRPDKELPTRLKVSAIVSGHELELPKSVSRAEFLAGQVIELVFPSEEREVPMFNLVSDGRIRLRWIAARDEIQIQDAVGQIKFASQLAGDGSELIQFKGRALRD